MRVTIYKSTGSWYIVQDDAGKIFNARIKGKFKIDDITSTNPLAVGDVVQAEMENELEGTLTITHIEPRKNYIIRKSKKLSKQSQIIATNIDRAYLIVTLILPKTSTGFIDRFLITAEAYSIPVSIIFNKSDTVVDMVFCLSVVDQSVFKNSITASLSASGKSVPK